MGVGRPMSFNDFFEERRINSCPVVSAETDDNDDSRAAEPQPLRRAITAGAQALMTSVASAAGFWKQSEHEATLEPMENLHISTPTDSLHGWTVQNFHIPPPLQSVQVPQPMEMSYVSQPIENCQPIQPMITYIRMFEFLANQCLGSNACCSDSCPATVLAEYTCSIVRSISQQVGGPFLLAFF